MEGLGFRSKNVRKDTGVRNNVELAKPLNSFKFYEREVHSNNFSKCCSLKLKPYVIKYMLSVKDNFFI